MITYSTGYLNDLMLRFIDRRAMVALQHQGQTKEECKYETLTEILLRCHQLHLKPEPYQQYYLSRIYPGKMGTDWS